MKIPEKISIDDYRNRFTLIIGDVKSGKTTLTQQILASLCQTGEGPITVVDLAPNITAEDLVGRGDNQILGGRLDVELSENIRYYHGRIQPPRLRSKDARQARTLAEENRHTIEALFEKALNEKTPVLFVNDGSLYLHSGSPVRFLEWIRSYTTAVVNGYFGKFFGESPISTRERAGMAFLMRRCDRLIRL